MAERNKEEYKYPIASRKEILNFISDIKEPVALKDLARHFSYTTSRDREALRRRLLAMVRDSELDISSSKYFGLPAVTGSCEGLIAYSSSGAGLLIRDDGEADVNLSRREMTKVLQGDRVVVELKKNEYGWSSNARITKILSRTSKELLGSIKKIRDQMYFLAYDFNFPQKLGIAHSPFEISVGNLVTARVVSGGSNKLRPKVELLELLSDELTPDFQTDISIRMHEIPFEFSDEVQRELDALPSSVNSSDKKGRIDLTEQFFVTIDGEDARDFDDAIYCKKTRAGFRLIVAIADVSHYVEPGSEMDEEAYSRGTSVYFPRKVIPMLPEKVSNYLCSLVPNEDRLVLACDMSISEEGEINSFEFYEAVINSRKRLTYTLVQDLIDSSSIDGRYESILHLLDLTKILLYQRSLRGALEFESEEPKFEFDQNGRICLISLNKRNFAHQMVEESMLCANLCAARFLVENEIPSLYRVHPEPEEEKKSTLRQSLLTLGLDLGHGNLEDYQQILQALKKFEAGQVIQLQVLRSMQQAVYKPENEGHFGLGYKEYTHFTSPIRRYPDLLIHRLIKSYLLPKGPDLPSSREKKMKMRKNPYLHNHNNLASYGEHLSYTERRADEAVFSFLDWAKCDFISGRIGAEFSGLISAVTKFGFFVKLESLPIEGLVHIKSLKEDYFDFHDKDISLRGRNSNISFAVGDAVSVRLTAVNADEKKIDLDLINHRPMIRKKSKKDKKTKNRKRNSRGR